METDWSEHWKDHNNFLWKMWCSRVNLAYRKMVENIDLERPKILELGSGSGINSFNLTKIFGAEKVVLVDFNQDALEICKERFKDSSFDVKYIQKDFFNLNLDEKFDIVHSEGLIEHFFEGKRIKALGKHIDLCKKGGYIIVFVPLNDVKYKL